MGIYHSPDEAVAVSTPRLQNITKHKVPEKQRIKPTKLPMTIGKLELIPIHYEVTLNIG
jgi:hypothetical protein